MSFEAIKATYKTKSSSPAEKLVRFMVSLSRGVCAEAYVRSVAHLQFLFARASWGARDHQIVMY